MYAKNGKSRYIKNPNSTTEARQHRTHAMWPNTKRWFFGLIISEINFRPHLEHFKNIKSQKLLN